MRRPIIVSCGKRDVCDRRIGQTIAIPNDLPNKLRNAAWIIDALLGTGARGEPRPPFDAVIDAVNNSGVPVLAVDLPSGLDCDTGKAVGAYNSGGNDLHVRGGRRPASRRQKPNPMSARSGCSILVPHERSSTRLRAEVH